MAGSNGTMGGMPLKDHSKGTKMPMPNMPKPSK